MLVHLCSEMLRLALLVMTLLAGAATTDGDGNNDTCSDSDAADEDDLTGADTAARSRLLFCFCPPLSMA